jgi:hypothetical protein
MSCMTKNLIIIILLLISDNLKAQDSTLRYDRNTHKVYLGPKKMTMDDLFKTMKPHPESLKLIESARDCKFYATIFYTLGAAPVGFTVGYLLFTNEVKWPVLATGVGLIGIGVPLHVRYLKQTQKAVNTFNTRNNVGALMKNPLEFSLNINQYGLGLRLKL